MPRFENNLNVIALINKDIDLKSYSGFGGLHKIMTTEQHAKLKQVLGDTEYQNVMSTCKTAYYTPTSLINCIYSGLNAMGFKGGRILEPACGHGAFIFNMPNSIVENSIISAIELDRLSARITKAICPYAKVLNAGFEKSKFKENTFDAVIGNPPYSGQKISDVNFPSVDGMVMHHYFVAKSTLLLKHGGLMAMVLPQYCLDNVRDHPRHFMNQYGSLVAAFRLPDCMFDNAKVTVDIVFFIKDKINDTPFTETKKINVKGHKLNINEYFFNNPEHVLGELNTCNMYGERIGLTVTATQSRQEVCQQLESLVSKLPVCVNSINALPDSDILNRLQLAVSKLQEKQNTSHRLDSKMADFEIEKLSYLKSLYEEQLDSQQQITNQIENTIAAIA
jgi:predicted RNA methylase|tara:strand:- start:7248 stop:8423 length:1176 start_codon:yes stop_codon:yes gene_type:complete